MTRTLINIGDAHQNFRMMYVAVFLARQTSLSRLVMKLARENVITVADLGKVGAAKLRKRFSATKTQIQQIRSAFWGMGVKFP